jgi:ubiquinone/menaquinone biosynthesis C-methylase UbiE
MINLKERFGAFIGSQHYRPTGFVGRLVGEKMVRQHRPETAWAVSLLALQSADQVLEIGFGAGRAIELMVEQVTDGHIFGLDHSRAMVQAASHRNARAISAGRVTLQQGDIASLPFADQQFDKILSIHTFYFWPSEHSPIIQGLFRVLKPGGKLILVLATGSNISPDGERTFTPLQTTLEEKILPGMLEQGFTSANLVEGPDNRQFNNVAVIGVR